MKYVIRMYYPPYNFLKWKEVETFDEWVKAKEECLKDYPEWQFTLYKEADL